jgi:hypothetical protein
MAGWLIDQHDRVLSAPVTGALLQEAIDLAVVLNALRALRA